MLKIAVIIQNVTAKCYKLRSNFAKNPSHVTAFFKKLQSFSKKNCSYFLKLLSYL